MSDFVDDLVSRLELFKDVLLRLDNKDKSISQFVSREDVVFFLRIIDGQLEVEDFVVEGFNVVGLFFMVCVYFLVLMIFMRNFEEFVEKVRRIFQNVVFKEDLFLL